MAGKNRKSLRFLSGQQSQHVEKKVFTNEKPALNSPLVTLPLHTLVRKIGNPESSSGQQILTVKDSTGNMKSYTTATCSSFWILDVASGISRSGQDEK